jgi:hypothetical protein
MFFENYYIQYSLYYNINNFSSYRILMTRFINMYIQMYNDNYSDKKMLEEDSIIYAKYYVYYKNLNCTYSDKIMKIMYDIDYLMVSNSSLEN